MYVVPDFGSSQAVAPETIGTFSIGNMDLSYAYTSAVLRVYSRTVKFFPRQQVSAFVSHSLKATVPDFGSGCCAATEPIRRVVITLDTDVDVFLVCHILLFLFWIC